MPEPPASFANEPLTDFAREENIRKMEEALGLTLAQCGKRYQLVIGGERYTTPEYFPSLNPAHRGEVVGYFCKATEQNAEQAMQAALAAFESWKNVPAERRADLLFRSAAILRRRKLELAAWMIYEVGKTWAEA